MPAAEFELGESIQSRYSHSEPRSPTWMGRRSRVFVSGSNNRTVWLVELREGVRGDDRRAQDAPAGCDVVGVGVGQNLEERERHHQLADAADVLRGVAAVLGIAGGGRVTEIEDSQAVASHRLTEQVGDLPREPGVRGGKIEVLPDQTQVDVLHGQQRTGRLPDVANGAGLGQPQALESADAGLAVAVERIGAKRRRTQHATAAHERCDQKRHPHFGTPCMETTASGF